MKSPNNSIESNNRSVKPRISFYTKYGKRALDIILSSVALVCLSPIFLVLYLLELKYHGKPALYKTKRPGLYCKPFEMLKFRSMTNETDSNGELLPDSERLTAFGKFIRKWSLDELPELINVLRGDMSIIGPRPLLCKYVDLYTPRYKMRQCVRPGLCCVSVNKHNHKRKNGIRTWREQFEDDIFYVEHVSLLLDMRMVIAVIKKVFMHEKYRAEATRVEFDGTNLDETRSLDEIQRDREEKTI